jgi:ubiquinone/menaquinone biosynthesis C-methylase UbiE
MNHADHVDLIARGIAPGGGGVWADLGAGTGAFTLALRELAGPGVEIVAVDRDPAALRTLRAAMERRFPGTRLRLLAADFDGPLELPPLDGIVAANAIHFVPDQAALLRRWREWLKPAGRLIVVEYDAETGNPWVPHPLSFRAFAPLARAAGYRDPVPLGSRPSRWMGRIYAAATSPVAAGTDPESAIPPEESAR